MRRLALYALIGASLLLGLGSGRAVFLQLAALFAALLPLSYTWAWMAMRGISLQRRTLTRRSQVGRELDEIFHIRNRHWLPKLWLELRDYSDLPGHRCDHVITNIRPRGEHRWSVRTQCKARGAYRLGPMQLNGGDPFGLYTLSRRLPQVASIVVYPATLPIANFNMPKGILSGGGQVRRRAHFVTTNADGVREYVHGDSFNRIHWRSTARHDKLMVKEFELDPLADVWLFVDFSADSLYEAKDVRRRGNTGNLLPHDSQLPDSTEEYVVVCAASLARYFIQLERALGFVAYTPQHELHQPERGERQLELILQSLATARSFSNYSLSQMLVLDTPNITRGTTLVIVTASLDKEWVTQVRVLSRRGITPLCVLIEPGSFGARGGDAEQLQSLLQLARIPTVVVRCGDNVASALEQPLR